MNRKFNTVKHALWVQAVGAAVRFVGNIFAAQTRQARFGVSHLIAIPVNGSVHRAYPVQVEVQ